MSQKSKAFVMRVMYVAMMVAVCTDVAVPFLALRNDLPPSTDPGTVQTMTIVFGIVSIAMIPIVLVLRRATYFGRLDSFESESQARGTYFTMLIVTWALLESIAIYGLTLAMLAQDPLYTLPFAGFSLLTFLAFPPRWEKHRPDFTESNAQAEPATSGPTNPPEAFDADDSDGAW